MPKGDKFQIVFRGAPEKALTPVRANKIYNVTQIGTDKEGLVEYRDPGGQKYLFHMQGCRYLSGMPWERVDEIND